MDALGLAIQQEIYRRRNCAEEHNFRCSATRTLPAEILCQIFRIIFASHSGLPLFVTHVCRAWRSVALADPHLWTDLTKIRGCTPELARELISRTKDLPLDINYWGDEDDTDTDTDVNTDTVISCLKINLISTPHRFRTLSFFSPDDEFLARFVYPTPSLVKLRFRCGKCLPPPNFLGGCAPRLHSLSLKHSNIPPVSPWMQNIRTLRVSSLRFEDGDQKALTDALEAMPVLEFLSLASLLPARDIPLSVPKAIHLGHLTRINLTIEFSQILDCISCPNLSTLHMTCPRRDVLANIDHVAKFFVTTTGATLTSIVWSTRGHLRRICFREASSKCQLAFEGCRVSIPDDILNYTTAICPTPSGLDLNGSDIPFPLYNLRNITDLSLQDGHDFLFEGDTADLFPSLKRLTYEKAFVDVGLVAKLTCWMDRRETVLETLTFQKCGGLTTESVATLEQRSVVHCEGCHIDCRRGHTKMSEIALCTCLLDVDVELASRG